MAKEYMAEEIAAAEACRVQTKDAEYYLDTSKYMLYDYNMEFPLYSRQNDSNECDYLGTTGYSFQLCGSYIYIKSDIYWEDYPVGEITRIVNLKTRSITPFGYNVDIFIPDDGDSVYYTIDAEGSIYKADPSLAHPKKYTIEIPETSCVKKEYSESGCLCEDIATTGVDDGWIYFYYDAFEYEGPGIYEGNYRIRTNGSGLEKTDEGHFYDK